MILHRYVVRTHSLSPRVTWRKMRRKIGKRLKRDVGRMLARLVGTEISDADFLRALDSRFPTIQAFLDHMAARKESHFFLDPSRCQEFAMGIRACCPEAEMFTIAAADRACEHVFDLLGSGPTHLGGQIDWHVDFKTGHRFDPHQYYADVRPAPYPGGYDIKVPWELSRCQHFAWLGQTYWFTGDEKYAQEFVVQVLDWIEGNPSQFGVNWACTMDVAIRAVNWLWGYYFFQDSPSLNDEFRLAFFKSLLVHGRHIMNNLERSGTLTTNHYLSDIVSLVYLGILLPEFKEARRWRDFGLQELEKEMFKQVYPDGVDFEASVSYHRLVAELFLSAVLLARQNGYTFSKPFMDRLEKMLEFTMYVTKPDGTVPLIGDNDNGRLHRLKVWGEPEREWVDHRYLLAIGAVLFERDDFAQAAGDQWEEAVWLYGQQAGAFKQEVVAKRLPPQRLESRAFPDAGLYFMRHDDLYLVVDAGPNGQNGNGGHAHNDTLSFELYAHGQTWIMDPGTYVYTADYQARNRFRSTAYHNTAMVDGEEQNRFREGDLFALKQELVARVLRWEIDDNHVLFEGEHDGYTRLEQSIMHRRVIRLDKRSRVWVIEDFLTGEGEHTFQIHWHLAQPQNTDEQTDEFSLDLSTSGPQIANWRQYSVPEQVAPSYGSLGQGVHVVCEVSCSAPVRAVAAIKFEPLMD